MGLGGQLGVAVPPTDGRMPAGRVPRARRGAGGGLRSADEKGRSEGADGADTGDPWGDSHTRQHDARRHDPVNPNRRKFSGSSQGRPVNSPKFPHIPGVQPPVSVRWTRCKTHRPERHAKGPPANLARTPGCTGEFPSAFLVRGPLGWVTGTTYQVGRPSLRQEMRRSAHGQEVCAGTASIGTVSPDGGCYQPAPSRALAGGRPAPCPRRRSASPSCPANAGGGGAPSAGAGPRPRGPSGVADSGGVQRNRAGRRGQHGHGCRAGV